MHSREQTVEAAIEILDRVGTRGLTLRGLAAELGGGLGSVYWHVAGKDELLALASEELVGRALAVATGPSATSGEPAMEVDLGPAPPEVLAAAGELRRTAVALSDQMEQHPWLPEVTRFGASDRPQSLRTWELLGAPLARMGLTPRQQFHGSTAVVGYVLGVSGVMAAQDVSADATRSKQDQFAEMVTRWQGEEFDELPWIRSMAQEFRDHDDRAQFVAGLDLLISGLVRQAQT